MNYGCSDVAAESRFAQLREHFQAENALTAWYAFTIENHNTANKNAFFSLLVPP